jgi:hypothetical protein
MDHTEPKTRRELKGKGGRREANSPYTQKHVRQLEAILEKRKLQKLGK